MPESVPATLAEATMLLAAARAEWRAAQVDATQAKAEAARAQAANTSAHAMIVHMKLEIEKLRRQLYGQRSERTARLIEQMELQLEELEADASADELAAEQAAKAAADAGATPVRAFTRKRPTRKPFPEHLPRDRFVVPGPTNCACCGSANLRKMGEDVTETLEVIPRQWKVTQTVREKFTCRDCEKISQPPAPFHAIPRGFAGASLLAMIMFEKFGQHQPLNRQSERYAREGIDLSLSTLADLVGACAKALAPLHALIEAYVLAAGRLHGDDTTVPILAKGKTVTGRVWTYVRDDRPFGGTLPAALFYASSDRRGEHPARHLESFAGILQADAYSGYNQLWLPDRTPGPIVSALCWAHARRNFFELADIASKARRGKQATPISPMAFEAVKRMDELFEIERGINGLPPAERLTVRTERSAPIVAALMEWMQASRARLSRHNPVAKAMDYMLARQDGFTRFLHDGRICLTNNAAERALRGIALGRKAWLFAGSERGAERTAFMLTLIVTAKLNDIDPQAWLADVLTRMPDMPQSRLHELLPWNWKNPVKQAQAA